MNMSTIGADFFSESLAESFARPHDQHMAKQSIPLDTADEEDAVFYPKLRDEIQMIVNSLLGLRRVPTTELGNYLGLSRTAMYNRLNGRYTTPFTVDEIERIAHFFGIRPGLMFQGLNAVFAEVDPRHQLPRLAPDPRKVVRPGRQRRSVRVDNSPGLPRLDSNQKPAG